LALDSLSLTFPNNDKYMVRKLEESRPHQCQYPLRYRVISWINCLLAPEDLMKYGTTDADTLLFNFLEKRGLKNGRD
jgi:hypothetical protein